MFESKEEKNSQEPENRVSQRLLGLRSKREELRATPDSTKNEMRKKTEENFESDSRIPEETVFAQDFINVPEKADN